jgi:hypothetical protein
MGGVGHSVIGPPHTHGRALMEAAQQATITPQAHHQEPQWDIGYGGGYLGHHKGSSYYPSHFYPVSSLRVETSAFARYPDWCTPSERYASYGADQVEHAVEGIR